MPTSRDAARDERLRRPPRVQPRRSRRERRRAPSSRRVRRLQQHAVAVAGARRETASTHAASIAPRGGGERRATTAGPDEAAPAAARSSPAPLGTKWHGRVDVRPRVRARVEPASTFAGSPRSIDFASVDRDAGIALVDRHAAAGSSRTRRSAGRPAWLARRPPTSNPRSPGASRVAASRPAPRGRTKRDGHRALPHRRGDSLDGAAAHVAGREDAGQARSRADPPAVAAGDDVAVRVEHARGPPASACAAWRRSTSTNR